MCDGLLSHSHTSEEKKYDCELLIVLIFVHLSFSFQYKFLPVAILPAYMIVVGLLSGAVYVNVSYMVLTDEKYKEERELCVNITAIFITVGEFSVKENKDLGVVVLNFHFGISVQPKRLKVGT